MTLRTRSLLIVLIALALAEGAFFALSFRRLSREVGPARAPSAMFPSRDELAQLVPAIREGTLTEEFADLDGDGTRELVVGFAVDERRPFAPTAAVPRFGAFRKLNGAWQLLDEFDFAIDQAVFAETGEWRLRGVPSFERKDVNNDAQEELFIRFDIGSEFFHAVGVVVWRGGAFAWVPMLDVRGRQIPPLFLDGGSTAESRRFIVEDAGNGGGLDFIAAHGTIDPVTGIERWAYDVYVEEAGTFRYDQAFSQVLTTAGRPPG